MLIRRATAGDIPAIRALASQSPEAAQWSEQHYDALVGEDSSRLALVAEDVDVETRHAASLLAAEGGIPLLGFLVAHAIAGEFELENVAVAARARRRGIGRSLVAELVKAAVQQGLRAIHLEVRGQNRAARALYEGLGFIQSGVRRGYYDCPVDDAILYSREISGAAPENG
jgi:[ribosomal protein S18]-alanine N-acetyltransferase